MSRENKLTGGAQAARRASDVLRPRYFEALDHLPVSDDRRRDLRRLVTDPSDHRALLACDFVAQEKSVEVLIDRCLAYYDRHASLHSHTVMGTFAWDLGVSSLDTPDVPLRALRTRIDKIMRRAKLHGVYFIELEIILAVPGVAGPRLHAHVHMACWHDKNPIRPKKLAAEIVARHKLTNDLKARPVVFTRRKRNTKNVIRLAGYLAKVPACVKQVKPRRKRPGNRLSSEQQKYSNRLVMRMVEILSQLTIYECVGGVGQGKEISRAWHADLRAWAKEREKRWLASNPRKECAAVTREGAERIWHKLRRKGRIKGIAVSIAR